MKKSRGDKRKRKRKRKKEGRRKPKGRKKKSVLDISWKSGKRNNGVLKKLNSAREKKDRKSITISPKCAALNALFILRPKKTSPAFYSMV